MDLQRSGSDQNLDSLLDTMANVVGILVVVMAVAQITVGQAVQRIRASEEELAAREHEAAPEPLETLRSRWAEAAPRHWETRRELERLRERLARHPDTARASAATARRSGELASAELAAHTLEQEIASRESELAALQLQLDSDHAEALEDVAAVRLPNPRPAPIGSAALGFGARDGQLVPLPLEALVDELGRVVGDLSSSRGLFPGREEHLDPLMRFFDLHPVGNALHRWRIDVRPLVGPLAWLEWRPQQAGESWREVRREGSSFRDALRRTNPRWHFVKFRVWADSFQVYLVARRIAEEEGFAVGWDLLDENEEIEIPFNFSPRSGSRGWTPVD